MVAESDVVQTITTFLEKVRKPTQFEPETRLFGDGLGLDSLEAAELSAVLEDNHGVDPFAEGPMPDTVGDILRFYAERG